MTASLLVLITVVATGNQGKPAGTGHAGHPVVNDPTARAPPRAVGAPPSVEDAVFTLTADVAGESRDAPSRRASTLHGGGGNRGSPGVETLLGGGIRGTDSA